MQMKPTFFLTALAILSIAWVTTPSKAQADTFLHAPSSHVEERARTRPPIGHVRFCRQRPEECRGGTQAPRLVKLAGQSWRDMDAINRAVNRRIAPVTDLELYGVPEHWTYPTNAGDCEDYLLLKRWMLMERGWPAEALLITVVLDRNGEGHAVLTVSTDHGDYILDNTTDTILPWHQTGYRFVKRQSRFHPGKWVSLGRGAGVSLVGQSG